MDALSVIHPRSLVFFALTIVALVMYLRALLRSMRKARETLDAQPGYYYRTLLRPTPWDFVLPSLLSVTLLSMPTENSWLVRWRDVPFLVLVWAIVTVQLIGLVFVPRFAAAWAYARRGGRDEQLGSPTGSRD